MTIYKWLNEDTKHIVTNYIDELLDVTSYYYFMEKQFCKCISFRMLDTDGDEVSYTVVVSENNIAHPSDLPILSNLEPFCLQQIRDSKLETLLNK